MTVEAPPPPAEPTTPSVTVEAPPPPAEPTTPSATVEAPPPPDIDVRPAAYYDRVYASDSRPNGYRPAWRAIEPRRRRLMLRAAEAACPPGRPPPRVLEVGCGTGQFAELLASRGVRDYRGFDFSAEAVRQARERLPRWAERIAVADAADPAAYADANGRLIICMETLEHLADDRSVVALWPAGVRVVLTVPTFYAHGHVRVFRSARAVRDRYAGLIALRRVEAIKVAGKGVRWHVASGRRT